MKADGEQAMDFQEADRRYAELKQQYEMGEINPEEFDAKLRDMMVQDGNGRWWAKSRSTGEWHYHDGVKFVPGTPPGYRQVASDHPQDSATVQTDDSAGSGTQASGRLAALWIVLGILSSIIALFQPLFGGLRDPFGVPGEACG